MKDAMKAVEGDQDVGSAIELRVVAQNRTAAL